MDIVQVLKGVLERCSWRTGPGLHLIGLRGSAVVKGEIISIAEQTDRFDDTLFAVDFTTGKIWHAPCTAGQPGWYWINKYRSGEGAPITRYGQYDYIRGPHRGKSALRQRQQESGRLAVIRDINKDGIADGRDRYDYPLDTGINIHASGGIFGRVGAASSGCHVIESNWGSKPWTDLQWLVYTKYREQDVFPYAVLPLPWLDGKTIRLLMGSRGEKVRKLQEFLKGKGIDCPITGAFYRDTDIAYRRHQKNSGQVVTGICNNPPW